MELGSVSLDFAASDPSDPGDLSRGLAAVLSFEPTLRPDDRADVTRLREALARAFAAVAGGVLLDERDAATLNSHAADEPPVLRVGRDGSASRVATDPVAASLAAIARDAIETIARDGAGLRICSAADCARVFLDRSHGRRRRWCSMRGCGNRAKVSAFRRRSHER